LHKRKGRKYVLSISSIDSGANSIDTLIDRFMAKEREPVKDLESQKKELNRRMSVFTDLKTKLSSLRDKANDFTRAGTLNVLHAKKAASSDESYFTVNATAAADTGNHTLKIDRLAAADTGVSSQFERDAVYGFTTGVQEFTLALGSGDAETISITIDAGDTYEQVMNKIADAVDATGLAVSASVVYDTNTTARLVIKSTDTGSDNFLNMTEINGSDVLRSFNFLAADGTRRLADGASGGFLALDTADLDAKINFDGIDIIKGTNEINDILPGISITLHHVQNSDDEPLSLSVSSDTENIRSEIEKFIEQFNETITYLNTKTSVDTVNFTRGDLAGDIVFSSLKFSLRGMVSGIVYGLPDGDPQLLSQIGIGLSREGTLSIKDSSKFEEALNGDVGKVTQLFTAENGVGNKLTELLDTFVNAGGKVDRSKKGVTRQISSIDTRIKNYEARLALREQILRRQFTELQKSLNLLNSQRSMLQSYQLFSFQPYQSGGWGY